MPLLPWFLILAGFGGDGYVKDVQTHRKARDAEFREKDTSPFIHRKDRKRFRRLDYFAVDTAWRLEARVERFPHPDTLDFPTSAGTVKRYLRWAELHFTTGGTDCRLEAFRSVRHLAHPVYGRKLFVPFTDGTTGEVCYGGGRYLDVVLPAAEADTLVLDFNFAYNPWCAYSDGWSCPLPPERNELPVRVEAGEKVYDATDEPGR